MSPLLTFIGQYTEDDNDAHSICVVPPHHRCTAHTLNLIANNEVDTWLGTSPESRAVCYSATAKCSAMWTKASLRSHSNA